MGKLLGHLQGLTRLCYLNITDFFFFIKLCFGFTSELVSSVCGGIRPPAGPFLFCAEKNLSFLATSCTSNLGQMVCKSTFIGHRRDRLTKCG